MHATTSRNYDVCMDGVYWRLTSLEEWEYLWGLVATTGLTWRDADATKHRLVRQYGRRGQAGVPQQQRCLHFEDIRL